MIRKAAESEANRPVACPQRPGCFAYSAVSSRRGEVERVPLDRDVFQSPTPSRGVGLSFARRVRNRIRSRTRRRPERREKRDSLESASPGPSHSPSAVVRDGRLKKITVDWYGGCTRTVQIINDTGHWYKGGQGLVPIRWVFVRDDTGKRRDEYFYTTNPSFSAATIIHWFTCRWSIETTFQEMRAHLGFETTRGWAVKTVLRTGPCLLGLFSVVSLIYHEHLKQRAPQLGHRPGYVKAEPTFSDAIAAVRRLFWEKTLFAQPLARDAMQKLPRQLRQLVFDQLCQTA